MAPLDPILSR